MNSCGNYEANLISKGEKIILVFSKFTCLRSNHLKTKHYKNIAVPLHCFASQMNGNLGLLIPQMPTNGAFKQTVVMTMLLFPGNLRALL